MKRFFYRNINPTTALVAITVAFFLTVFVAVRIIAASVAIIQTAPIRPPDNEAAFAVGDAASEQSDSEDSQVESSQAEVSKVESSQAEVSKVESSHAEVSKVESSHAEVSKIESSHAEVSKVESSQAEVSKVESSQAEVSKVESSQAEVSKVESSQAEVSKVESSQAEVSKVESSQAEVSKVESSQAEVSEVKTLAEVKKAFTFEYGDFTFMIQPGEIIWVEGGNMLFEESYIPIDKDCLSPLDSCPEDKEVFDKLPF